MTQGYCTPVFNATKTAGLWGVLAACFAYNGEMQACADGNKCAVLSAAPTVMQMAMKLALDALGGKEVPLRPRCCSRTRRSSPPPIRLSPSRTSRSKRGLPEAGKNFYPDLPPGMALPYTLPEYADQISGQPGSRKVRHKARIECPAHAVGHFRCGAGASTMGIMADLPHPTTPLYEARNVSKSFGGIKALIDATFPCFAGEVQPCGPRTAPARAR